MKLTRVIAIGVIVSSLGIGAVTAQSISSNEIPAEFPPNDFKGKQFVDSRGCVYIRAGVDGATTWVPRVTRDRKVICGFKPTFSKAQTTTSAAPKLDKNVVQIQPAAPEAGTPSVAAAPKAVTKAPATTTTKTTTRTTTAPKQAKGAPLYTTPTAARPATTTKKTTTRTAAPAATVAAPKVIQPAPTTTTAPSTVRRTTKQAPRAAGVVSPCREGVTTWKGSPVRCGPQALSPVTPGTGRSTAQPPKMRFDQNSSLRRPPVGTVVKVGEVDPDVRVVPRHVYEANTHTQVVSVVPEGYRRAFDDGRLNERRAEMTLAGQAQMAQIWTTSVPGKLVETSENGDVVARAASTSVAPATVSTKSEPTTKSLRLAGTPYVQVGTYSDAAGAQAAAKQVKRLGLPVRIGKYERNGVTQRMVLAGPFSGADGANAALAKTQNAGFGGAFVRQ